MSVGCVEIAGADCDHDGSFRGARPNQLFSFGKDRRRKSPVGKGVGVLWQCRANLRRCRYLLRATDRRREGLLHAGNAKHHRTLPVLRVRQLSRGRAAARAYPRRRTGHDSVEGFLLAADFHAPPRRGDRQGVVDAVAMARLVRGGVQPYADGFSFASRAGHGTALRGHGAWAGAICLQARCGRPRRSRRTGATVRATGVRLPLSRSRCSMLRRRCSISAWALPIR